jgi:hypothetical protein
MPLSWHRLQHRFQMKFKRSWRPAVATKVRDLRPTRSVRPLLERLEDRITPVVNPTLTYNGGTLLANVKVESVFYNDPTSLGLQPSLDNFFKAILPSQYLTGLLHRFSDGGFTIGAGSFVGHINNGQTIAPGGTVSDGNIETMLSNQIAAHKLIAPTNNTLYFVFAPAGVEVSSFGTNSVFGFLGYHSSFVDSGTNKTIYYAVMPFPGSAPNGKHGPDGSNASLGIEAEFSLGLNSDPFTKLQDLTGVSMHELAEAITDPGVGNPDPAHPSGDLGWLDTTDPFGNGQPGGFENGDLANGELATYKGFVVQEMWGRKTTDPAHKATGQVVAPADTDFMITKINNPTEGLFNGVFATFVDADGATELPSAFTVTVDWGDGTPVSASNDGLGDVTVTSNHNGTFNILGKHNYKAESGTAFGTYPYNFDGAQVFIASGSEFAWNKPRIVLQEAKLTAVTGVNFTGSSGHALINQRVATFVDAGGLDGNTAEYHATINWGDGTAPDSATIITNNGGGKFSVFGKHHVYAKPGVYTVKTTILHGGAQFTATASGMATVSAAAASNQSVGNASKLPQPAEAVGAVTPTDRSLAASLTAAPTRDKAPGSGVLLANDAVHIHAIHGNPASGISDADLFGAL